MKNAVSKISIYSFVGQLVLFSLLSPATSRSQEAEKLVPISVEKIQDAAVELAAIKNALQIMSLSNRLDFGKEYHHMELRFEFYKEGKKVDVKSNRAATGAKPDSDGFRYGRLQFTLLDLDYLKLGNAPERHWRIECAMMAEREGGSVGGGVAKFDVSKTSFNVLASSRRMGFFKAFMRESDGSIPLFFCSPAGIKVEDSLAKILESNPTSDFLIGILSLK